MSEHWYKSTFEIAKRGVYVGRSVASGNLYLVIKQGAGCETKILDVDNMLWDNTGIFPTIEVIGRLEDIVTPRLAVTVGVDADKLLESLANLQRTADDILLSVNLGVHKPTPPEKKPTPVVGNVREYESMPQVGSLITHFRTGSYIYYGLNAQGGLAQEGQRLYGRVEDGDHHVTVYERPLPEFFEMVWDGEKAVRRFTW